jgi:hypothetical protein
MLPDGGCTHTLSQNAMLVSFARLQDLYELACCVPLDVLWLSCYVLNYKYLAFQNIFTIL